MKKKHRSNRVQWTEQQYREYMQKFPNSDAIQASNVEQSAVDEPETKNAVEEMATPVHIRIHQARSRLGDIDGYYAKPVVDGIRCTGLLPDDGPKYVIAVTYTHERIHRDSD